MICAGATVRIGNLFPAERSAAFFMGRLAFWPLRIVKIQVFVSAPVRPAIDGNNEDILSRTKPPLPSIPANIERKSRSKSRNHMPRISSIYECSSLNAVIEAKWLVCCAFRKLITKKVIFIPAWPFIVIGDIKSQ